MNKKIFFLILITILSSFNSKVFSQNDLRDFYCPIINTSQLIEQLEIIEPIFIYPEINEKINYEHLCLTTKNLIQLYGFLIEKYEIEPTKKFEIYIEIVGNLLQQIKHQIDQLCDSYLTQLRQNNFFYKDYYLPNQNPNNTNSNFTNMQNAIQIAALLEQSNQTISQFQSRNRWTKIRAILIIGFGAVVVLGVAIACAITYKKINDIFQDDYKKLSQKVDKAESLLLKTQKLTTDALGTTSSGLEDLKEKIKEAEEKLQDMLTQNINPLKIRFEKALLTTKSMSENRKRLTELKEQINTMTKTINDHEELIKLKLSRKDVLLDSTVKNKNRIKEIETIIKGLESSLKLIEQNYSKLVAQKRRKHTRRESGYESE